MPITLDGTNGITQADQFNSDSTFGFKNRIINGAMVIDQRNAGASVTLGAARTYMTDRFYVTCDQASKLSAQQNAGSVTPPTGFTNYLGATSLSAYAVIASDQFVIGQRIEGFNFSDLAFGTANAKTVTLSFWVRSSLTGTFGGSLQNGAADRSYPFTYTISSASTWEQKSVTIAGDTSGTWLTTNGIGARVAWGLGVGSTYSGTAGAWAGTDYQSATGATSVVGTNGATFYITGVQLEVGSTATSFDYRPYQQELDLCKRYYLRNTGTAAGNYLTIGSVTSATALRNVIQQSMRATPTVNYAASLTVDDASASPTVTSITNTASVGNAVYFIANASGGGLTTGRAGGLRSSNTTDWFDLSAEL